MNRNGFLIQHPQRPKTNVKISYKQTEFEGEQMTLFSEFAQQEIEWYLDSNETVQNEGLCKNLSNDDVICLDIFMGLVVGIVVNSLFVFNKVITEGKTNSFRISILNAGL